jgi:hypothetical protein
VKSTLDRQQQDPKGLLGYTVAQYGYGTRERERQPPQPQPQQHKYFGDDVSGPTSTTSPATTQQRKYFEKTVEETTTTTQTQTTTSPPSGWRAPASPESAQFEMTRSAEMTLYKKQQQQPQLEPEGGDYRAKSGTLQSTKSEHFYDQIPAHTSGSAEDTIRKAQDLPYAPLPDGARRTAERYREIASGQEAAPLEPPPATGTEQREKSPQMQAYVDPQSSRVESLTPGTRRKLQEHVVYKTEELKVFLKKYFFRFVLKLLGHLRV